MAAVTQGAAPTRHVLGDIVMRIFTVSGASGSTLPTGQSALLFVTNQQSTAAGTISLITAISYNAVTGVVTLTSSAPMVNEVIKVMSRVG